MLLVATSWGIIGVSAFLWGAAVLSALQRIEPFEQTQSGVTLRFMLGLCALTVYAEFFSLFYKVGRFALAGVLMGDIIFLFLQRKTFAQMLENLKKKCGAPWMFLASAVAFVFVLPSASSYIENYDTLLYHAQAIRWIEEYGVVKGIGNLHSRLAFNSAFFPLQALFSFKDIAGQSLHSMNGFVAWVMLAYAVCSMKFWRERRFFPSDFVRLVTLHYLDVVHYDFSSPGTDLFAQLLSLFILAEFLSCAERQEKNPAPASVLCILGVFVVTLKLSCALIVLLTILPAVLLIREKKWKGIAAYLMAGIVILLPFFVRNVIISGYLIYPMEKIDLFHVAWKMPPDVCAYERLRSKAATEGIFGIEALDAPFSVWFPYWQAKQDPYILRLLCADTAACLATLAAGAITWIRKKEAGYLVTAFTVSASLLYWFMAAPDVRYGRPFVMLPAYFAVGWLLSRLKMKQIATVSLAGMVFLCSTPIRGLYASARAAERFWIRCADYGLTEVVKVPFGDFSLYIPDGEIGYDTAGYYAFPAAISAEVLDNVEPLGSQIKDGFRVRTD